MSYALEIRGLRGGPAGAEIVKGVDLTLDAGQVAAVMGPNGSGKSTLLNLVMGRPGFVVTDGQILVGGRDVSDLPTYERARAGLFAGFQYPTEVPGVSLATVVGAAMAARGEDADPVPLVAAAAGRVRLDGQLLDRGLNEDYSGGEKKRAEVIQMELVRPVAAILDEIDSGLDVDALRSVAAEVERAAADGVAVLLITHYQRLLEHVRPSVVHVFNDGAIERSGGPELALELEEKGYLRGDR